MLIKQKKVIHVLKKKKVVSYILQNAPEEAYVIRYLKPLPLQTQQYI